MDASKRIAAQYPWLVGLLLLELAWDELPVLLEMRDRPSKPNMEARSQSTVSEKPAVASCHVSGVNVGRASTATGATAVVRAVVCRLMVVSNQWLPRRRRQVQEAWCEGRRTLGSLGSSRKRIRPTTVRSTTVNAMAEVVRVSFRDSRVGATGVPKVIAATAAAHPPSI